MKRLILLALLLFALPVHAVMIHGIDISPGAVFKSTTDLSNSPDGNLIDGAGRVEAIFSGALQTWAHADNGRELFYLIDSFAVGAVVPIGGTTTLEGTMGGDVKFYSLPLGTVDLTDPVATVLADIASGVLWLDLVALPLAHPSFAFAPTSVSLVNTAGAGAVVGTAFLDVTGAGAADALFDTQSIATGGGVFADLRYTYSRSGDVPVGPFSESGSGDFRALVLPAPGVLALFGLGVLGLGLRHARK